MSFNPKPLVQTETASGATNFSPKPVYVSGLSSGDIPAATQTTLGGVLKAGPIADVPENPDIGQVVLVLENLLGALRGTGVISFS